MCVQKKFGAQSCLLVAIPSGLGLPVPGRILACSRRLRVAGQRFFVCFEIDDLGAHFGPIIFSGRTTASKVASSTKPRLIASSFSVVPFLWAVFATVVALS